MRNRLQHLYEQIKAPHQDPCKSMVAFCAAWALSRQPFTFTQAACAGFADLIDFLFPLVAKGVSASKQAAGF